VAHCHFKLIKFSKALFEIKASKVAFILAVLPKGTHQAEANHLSTIQTFSNSSIIQINLVTCSLHSVDIFCLNSVAQPTKSLYACVQGFNQVGIVPLAK